LLDLERARDLRGPVFTSGARRAADSRADAGENIMRHSPRSDSGRGVMTATDRKGFDPLLIFMAAGLVVVVAALAYPAFRADPMSAPGLVLIFTVGAVALIGLFAFARGETRKPSSDAAVDLLDAMAEPAALVWATGQVLTYNAAWAEAGGATTVLPPARSGAKSASALYMAFAQARAGEQGRAIVAVGERELEVLIGRAGEGRFLLRAAPETMLPAGPAVV